MILKVFNYLEKLVQLIKPKKLLFMAIDGERVCLHSPRQACRDRTTIFT